MFHLTSSAAAEILAAAGRSAAEGMALRVAARQAADGSIDYGMGFDEARDGDQTLRFDGLTVLIGPGSHALLAGTALDYVEIDPARFDFVFIPPATACPADASTGRATAGAAASAGCGTGGCGRCGGSAAP